MSFAKKTKTVLLLAFVALAMGCQTTRSLEIRTQSDFPLEAHTVSLVAKIESK